MTMTNELAIKQLNGLRNYMKGRTLDPDDDRALLLAIAALEREAKKEERCTVEKAPGQRCVLGGDHGNEHMYRRRP